MWGWIADEIKKRKIFHNINILKMNYCIENELSLINQCFCCEYDYIENDSIDCSKCPLEWGSDVEEFMCLYKDEKDDYKGLYNLFKNAETWQEQEELARKIANLPVREGV